MRCPAPPCSVTKYRGSRCNRDAMRNVPKKWFDAAVAIEDPKRFPYPPNPWPYPSSEFCAWPIPAPKAELRKREGATLSSSKSSNFCLLLSGPTLVAILGKKIDRRPRTSMVVVWGFWCLCGVLSCFDAGASGRCRVFSSSCAAAVAATAAGIEISGRDDEQDRYHTSGS